MSGLHCPRKQAERVARIAMETLVHLGAGGLSQNRHLVSVEIPEVIWLQRQILPLLTLPVGWAALPAGKASLDYGDAWQTAP